MDKNIFRLRNILLGVFCVALISVGLYFFMGSQSGLNISYSENYRLVPEKISQSAAIRISLPKGVDKQLAEKGVTFDPQIKGTWVEGKQTAWWQAQKAIAAITEQKINTNFIVFKPQNSLDLDKYYAVKVDLGQGKILASDFLVAENPKVNAIFPAVNSEAPDNSKITIIFNRPMVPVTTIDQLEGQSIPVEISPATDGKFKWISTNTLQFIPKDHLKRSANYTVKVKNGFTSMDGLAVSNSESSFQVLKLRYADSENYTLIQSQIYNQPVRIYFNQPVDLSKTKSKIKITDGNTNQEIPFVAEYALKTQDETKNNPQYKTGDNFSGGFGFNFVDRLTASLLDIFTGKKGEVDQSIIELYPKKDSFGRSKFWDFNKNYTVTVSGAYSKEGDIALDTSKIIDVRTAGVVNQGSAHSDRTNLASLNLFDPQGYLTLTFFEDINLSKSRITAGNLQKIEYGQKCKDENSYYDPNCEKIQDNKKINIYFKSSEIKPGDKLSVNLEKVVNTGGLQINKDTINIGILTYGPLTISLGDSSKSYSNLDKKYLDGFYLCSNNPLATPDKKEFKQKISGNLDFQINSFSQSWPSSGVSQACPLGTMMTFVRGGFAPESIYNLNLDLNDVFGQNIKKQISFSTGTMEAGSAYAFGLQQRYSVTSPQNAVLNFGAQNVSYVDLAICKASAIDFKQMYDSNIIDSSVCSQYKTKQISLPEKYWVNNYFSVNLADYFTDPIGNYVVSVSNPLLSNYSGKLKNYVTVTNLAVAEKSIAPATDYLGSVEEQLSSQQISSLKNLYWVTDMKTQNPIAGAKISFYDKGGGLLGNATTNSDGLAFSVPSIGADCIVASYGSDSTVVMQNNDQMNWSQSAYNYKKTFIYTDKPLYRPEQTVHAKGILRIGYDGNYEMFSDKTIEVKIRNSKGVIALDKNVDISAFGTFNIDFVLDKNSPLGTYTICVKGSYDCAYFDILEYVPAAFQVSQTSSKSEYISKDTANLEVDANYYFGAPVDNSEVSYTISSQNYYFDRYTGDEWFNFGWWDDNYYDSGSYYYGDKFISRGSGTTDKDGKFKFSQKLDLQEMLKSSPNQGSRIIVLDSTVKNNLGQSVSDQKSFIVHAGNYYIGVKTDPYFVGKNQDFNLKVKTVDTEGKDVGVGNITADIYAVSWVYAKRQEVSGAFNYNWQEKKDLVKTINFGTDNNGNWSQKVKLNKEGQYDIELSSHDKAGNEIKSKTSIYVYGEGQATFMFDDSTSLSLKANKKDLKVGEQGQLIIESPYSKSKALITIERGKIFDYKIVDLTGNILGYNFTATDDYAPNVYVSVLLQSPDPAVKFASQEFTVNSDKSKIDLQATSDKKFYNPGDNVNLSIVAKDASGKPLKTEVSVAVVDLSVLALKGNPKKDPLVFFYNGFPLTVSTSSNIKNKIVRIEPADASDSNNSETKGGGGGGGADNKVRGDFRDTAFWSATVQTGDDGKAQTSFKLPDNLTTWQAEVLGVTKDTKLGVDYLSFQSKKDLMIVPLKPRFIVPEDTFSIGAQVFNQSDGDKTFKVSFKSDTLQPADNNKEKTVRVNKGEQQTVYFAVKAPAKFYSGSHSFTISASGGGLQDAVAQSIVIRQNSTYEVTATAGYTQGSDAKEVIYLPSNVSANNGDLTVKSSATLAVFLSDALNYLISYPYGCSEQISSKLKAIAIIKNGLKIPNMADKLKLEKVLYKDKEYTIDQLVDVGLSDLYKNQNDDGGFNMWGAGESNYFMTLSVVDAFNSLKKAGYTVNADALNNAADYLFRYYNGPDYNLSDDEKISLASVLLQTDGYRNNGNLMQTVSSIITDDSAINDQLSQKALAELGVLVSNNSFGSYATTRINNALDNRINIDSRGAFLSLRQDNYYYDYFESTIGDTALYLKSLADGQRDTAITDKIIRWILNSKDKDGAWGSTQNTLAVVEAFTDYLNWKKETGAVYTLDTIVNAKSVDKFAFNASTILEQSKQVIPISSLRVNDYNTLELKKTGSGSLYYDLGLKYYLEGNVEPRDEGFTITRQMYALSDKSGSNPLAKAKAGDLVREHLTIVAPVERRNVQIEDFIPAGMEIVDLSLATESKDLRFNQVQIKAPEIYPDFKEIRDDRAYIYTAQLDPGVYEFDYYLRALVPGAYSQLPAVVSEMYTPENFGRTGSATFQVTK
ncbi:MAG: MG2 domain-containing protein [Candidatus Staskawiczbacteria bacterium]|nr:MG2 domain-containing protein [Candidatus Staskawiczbacteria bacterium]